MIKGSKEGLGMMERWNTGILGLCVALHENGLLPVNHYSIIPIGGTN
jgi:hypothetical protein